MSPLVSTIITTYNYARYLTGALNSALGQEDCAQEVIVVDDGSSDNTPSVIQPYSRDPRVHYHRISHQGVVAAKNTGIQLARGQYLAFLDADDLWLPHKLSRQLELFRRDPDLGVVYSRRLVIDNEGRSLHFQEPALYRGAILDRMLQNNFVCFSSAIVPRRALDAIGLLDPNTSPSDDYDLWLRLARTFRFDYVDAPLVKYRVGHASLSRREDRITTVLGILARFLASQPPVQPIAPSVIRSTFAELYSNLALAQRYQSRPRALRSYLTALHHVPSFPPAWKGLGSLFLPEAARCWLRQSLGHPQDWRSLSRSPVADVPASVPPGHSLGR